MVVRSQIGHHPRSTKPNKQEAVTMATKKQNTTPVVVDEDEARKALIPSGDNSWFMGESSTPEAVAERMAKRVRSTTNMDELFDSLQGKASDQMVGRAFQFNSVEFQPYEADNGIIPLAVCEVVDLGTGEPTEFVTTGTMLVQFLRQAQLLNGYPFRARITEKVTKSGQKALNFERV